jgi:hypothetical protein
MVTGPAGVFFDGTIWGIIVCSFFLSLTVFEVREALDAAFNDNDGTGWESPIFVWLEAIVVILISFEESKGFCSPIWSIFAKEEEAEYMEVYASGNNQTEWNGYAIQECETAYETDEEIEGCWDAWAEWDMENGDHDGHDH